MRGILHWEDWGWSNAPRKGSNTSTTVQNNQPPPQFLAAYQQAVDQAQQVAAQPYTPYPGTPQSLVAGFSPDQLQAMDIIRGSQGIADPYINSAAQYMSNATAPLKTQDFTDYLTAAAGPGVTNAANTGVAGIQQANTLGQGMLADASQTGQSNILGASQSFQPGQINQWLSPYTQNVVNATQAQFNNQNAQQQAALKGNAASQGALGGDRLGVAQAELANQQQLAQAPTIANLYQQGYGQAVQSALQQAQLGTQGATAAGQLGAGLASTGAQLGAGTAQAAGAMGLQGATTQQQLQANAAQQAMAANQAQAWLNSQAGFGMGQLGQEALGSSLTGANALLGTGGMQQQLAQQYLNIPYEQYIAQQAYPFQTTGWFANIAEGLGSAAGGTGTSTTTGPTPSPLSQVAGLGLTGLGLYGLGKDLGFFGSGAGATAAASASQGLATSPDIFNAPDTLIPTARGGGITGRPHYALGGKMGDAATIVLPGGMGGIEDPSVAYVPEGASPMHGMMNILKNFGQTSTSSGGANGASQAGAAIGDIATIAKVVSLFLNHGGRIPHFDAGGAPSGGMVPQVTMKASGHGGPDVPVLSRIGGSGASGSLGGSGSSGGSLNDYLNSVLGQIPSADLLHPKPKAPNPATTPAATAPPPVPVISFLPFNGGGEGGPGSGGPDPSGASDVGSDSSGSSSGADPGGGGGVALGGRIGYADGGLPDYSPGDQDSQTVVLGGPEGDYSFSGVARDIGNMQQTADAANASQARDGKKATFLRNVAQRESGGNPTILNTEGSSASGKYQIIDSTWRDGMQLAGLDPSKYATAADAPEDVQDRVASALYDKYGETPWKASDPGRAKPQLGDQGIGPPPPPAGDPFAGINIRPPEKPNPWMTVLEAGLGMMAGTSPFPGVNIGRGALGAVKSYQSLDKDVRDLNVRIDEARARLAEAHAWHESTAGYRNDKLTQQGQIAQQRLTQAQTNAANRANTQNWEWNGQVDADNHPVLYDKRTGQMHVDTTQTIGLKPGEKQRADDQAANRAQRDQQATERAAALAQGRKDSNWTTIARTYIQANPGATDAEVVSHTDAVTGRSKGVDPLGIR